MSESSRLHSEQFPSCTGSPALTWWSVAELTIKSEDITRFYMAEVVMAIEAAHKLGFLHRDVKPENVLLDHGGHVKLTDFGLSTGGKKTHDNAYYRNLLENLTSKNKNRNSEHFNNAINLTASNRGQINTWR